MERHVAVVYVLVPHSIYIKLVGIVLSSGPTPFKYTIDSSWPAQPPNLSLVIFVKTSLIFMNYMH